MSDPAHSQANVESLLASLEWAPACLHAKVLLNVRFDISSPTYKFSGVEIVGWDWPSAPPKNDSQRKCSVPFPC